MGRPHVSFEVKLFTYDEVDIGFNKLVSVCVFRGVMGGSLEKPIEHHLERNLIKLPAIIEIPS